MINEHITVTSESQANRAIERFMRRVNRCSEDLAQALADEIRLETQAYYATQAADGNSCDVTVNPIDNGGRSVTASGKGVMFLEFGAGYGTDVGHEWAAQVGDVDVGTYSEAHNGPFYRTGHWTYGGRRYTGIQATRGLLNSFDDVSSRVETVARRVYR